MKNITLLFLFVLSINVNAQIYHADEWIEKGKQESYNGNYNSAIWCFLKAKQYAPELSDVYYLLGVNYQAINDCKSSKKNFKKYIELAPKSNDIEDVKKMIRNCGKDEWTKIDQYNKRVRSFFGLFYENPINPNIKIGTDSFYPSITHGVGIQSYFQRHRNFNYEFNIIYRYAAFDESILPKPVHNIELNFLNWRFMPRSPVFRTGDIVFRPMFSFGCGLGMNFSDEPGFFYLLDYNTASQTIDDAEVLELIFLSMNYLSWNISTGMHITTKDNPSGLVVDLSFHGIEQLRSLYEDNAPNIKPCFSVRIGWFFGLRG